MKHRILSLVSVAVIAALTLSMTSCLRRVGGDDTQPDTSGVSTNAPTQSPTEPATDPATIPATEPATEPQQQGDIPPAVSGNKVLSNGVTIDASAYAGYDNTLRGWGPGGAVNDRNQPAGSVMYNNKFGSYDALFMAQGDKNIYLTFDEGYENGYTEKILNTLRDKGVKAVFFVTYDYVIRNPELVRRMIDEGHVLGNHSMKHLSMPSLSADAAAEEIAGLHQYVKDNFGYEMNLFRPPMGEFSERTLAVTKDLGYKSVFWSFAHKDWITDDQPDSAATLEKVTKALHPGAIYLLHAVSATNTQILGDFIDNARAAGYVISGFYQ